MLLLLAQSVTEVERNLWVDFIVAWGPVFFIAGIIYVVLKLSTRRQTKYLTRAYEHMERLEIETTRVRELLESIDRRLGER